MPGKQELDEKILEKAYVVVDDVMQSTTIEKTELTFKKHLITKDH